MLNRDYTELPKKMQNLAVRVYFDMLSHKKTSLFFKRVFDIVASLLLLLLLSPLFILLALLIKSDSKGSVFYRQLRVTKGMRQFRIFKFRTMVEGADKNGSLVTTIGDSRVTKVGAKLRGARLDELPQLFNILVGDMTFVGTRPEVPKYVAYYNDEMLATLLLPAGVTSEASIRYKDEARLLTDASDADEVYIGTILKAKMVFNLEYLRDFSFWRDIKILFRTLSKMTEQD